MNKDYEAFRSLRLDQRASELRLAHSHSLKLLSVYAAELEALIRGCRISAAASNAEAVFQQIEEFEFA